MLRFPRAAGAAMSLGLAVAACGSSTPLASPEPTAPAATIAAPAAESIAPVATTVPASPAPIESTTVQAVASPAGGDFCSLLKDYQLDSEDRVVAAVTGSEADKTAYIDWSNEAIGHLIDVAPGETADFFERQRTILPALVGLAADPSSGGAAITDLLADPDYVASADAMLAWVTSNCPADVVKVVTQPGG